VHVFSRSLRTTSTALPSVSPSKPKLIYIKGVRTSVDTFFYVKRKKTAKNTAKSKKN
jgi:hypothetical protein